MLLEIDGVEISQDGRTADASCCGTFRKLPARTVPFLCETMPGAFV